MIKFSLLLLLAYLLYYAGNIIHDLFFKKETGKEEESEVFSFSDFSLAKAEPEIVGIEDVESLNMPKSFSKKEVVLQDSPQDEERLSLDELRQRFESELDLDDHYQKESEKKEETSKSKDNGWQNILNLSETMVQMVANIDGYKVYHSTM